MRIPRIKVKGRTAVYHCMTRTVAGEMLLGNPEKEKLRRLLWKQAAFCGVEVVTYCLMANHFHVLVRVPEAVSIPEEELVARVREFYGKKSLLVQTLEEALETTGKVPEDLRESLGARMGDVSVFMKELKQRFAKWYNKQHERFGTLWAERFKSVLVEDSVHAVQTVAMYVDLNPVRAGLVEDPEDYRFCGYAEAVAGHKAARQGIGSFHEATEWRSISAAYRKALLIQSGTASRSGKRVLDGDQIRKELERGATLAPGQVLRLRVRYFTDGMVLGSRNYVNEVFAEFRDRFSDKRKSGARPLRGIGPALGDLATARDLQTHAIG